MNNIKLEETEHISNGDSMCAEKPICLLEENDTQCGHVFYNEISRLLKFYCTYCRETYDNIEYFCQHLSSHIYDTYEPEEKEPYNEEQFPKLENEHDFEEQEMETLNEEEHFPNLEDKHEFEELEQEKTTSLLERDCEEFRFPTETNEHSIEELKYRDNKEINVNNEVVPTLGLDNIPIDDFDETEMIVEEIDEADEIRSEVEQEINQSIESDNVVYLNDEESCSNDFISYEEETCKSKVATVANKTTNSKSFEDCFIKETNIEKIRSEGICVLKEKKPIRRSVPRRTNFQDMLRLKRRRKKVTTVKVIAVKNRIAELYERIQNEKEKSQQILSINIQQHGEEQETQDAVECLINDKIDDKNPEKNSGDKISPNKEVSRKIIGETVITLIPEGTKIPNTLPSPIRDKLCLTGALQTEKRMTPVNYNDHKEIVTNDKRAICPACGKTFRSHFSLTIHKRIHYLESDSNVKLAHKCSDCDQLFNKLSQLKHHVETIHYPEGFICKICNRKLTSISLLERHMVKVHLDRPFNCQQCNKNFSDPITFEEHLVSHTSGEVFKCTTCGRKYSTEYFLLEHMRNHKEQVPQTCVVCGKVTLRITQHMKIHTPRPKRLLSCTVCGKVFNFSSGLSHHFKIMHKLPRPPPKAKKEPNPNAIKRKRRSRTTERLLTSKKKHDLNSSSETSFTINQEKFAGEIIEQIEIPHEVYDTTPDRIVNLDSTENHQNHHQSLKQINQHSQLHEHHNHQLMHHVNSHHHSDDFVEDVYHKEEEAKRVIVELIQNSTYTSFFPDNLSSVLEVTPPIAREETISAVNSIVHDC